MSAYDKVLSARAADRKQGTFYIEQITMTTADELVKASDSLGKPLGCAVSVNAYGKGHAVYFAPECNAELLGMLYDYLQPLCGLPAPMALPKGVIGRRISEKELFLVNTTGSSQEVPLPAGQFSGILSESACSGRIILAPYGAELLVN